MNVDTFVAQRRPSWQRLEDLLGRTRTDLKGLSPHEVEEIGRLYRGVTSDLAIAQRDFPGQKVTTYLNQLVGRAHTLIYRSEPLRWGRFRHFYALTFPALYRELLPYTTVAFLIFGVTALVAFGAVMQRSDNIYLLEGPGIRPLVREVEEGRLWTEIEPALRSAASAFILTNNIQVAFLAFAGGITAGLLTAWIMFSNGLHLGAIFGLLAAFDMAGGLVDFVVAHGFIELSVIFVAGGCGLYVGDGLLRPGLRARSQVLVRRGRRAVTMLLGCAPLLILAGLIEGFISPSTLPFAVKLGIGLASGAALHAYWLRWGRARPATVQSSGRGQTGPHAKSEP